DSSEEAPGVRGLGIWQGGGEHFPAAVKAPHVGLNHLEIANGASLLFQNLPSGACVFFTHSYRVPMLPATVAACEYGGKFSAAVEQDSVFGVQFHPEKSGTVGLKLLENFCGI